MSNKQERSVILGRTTRTEVVSYFKNSGDPPVTSVLVYLSYWRNDLSVRWLGMASDVSTSRMLKQEAARLNYLTDPTQQEYTAAINYLIDKLPGTPRGFIEHDRVTIEELRIWQSDHSKRGF